ncbi:MAG TPA: hypothetical protein VG942_00690 [Hyphomonadaceae bacterium]|nr:hypothetical protein [Hyphomonadaceae bacterium]
MSASVTREAALKSLRDRRENLARQLASLEPSGALSAREVLTWRTRIAQLDGRIASYAKAG